MSRFCLKQTKNTKYVLNNYRHSDINFLMIKSLIFFFRCETIFFKLTLGVFFCQIFPKPLFLEDTSFLLFKVRKCFSSSRQNFFKFRAFKASNLLFMRHLDVMKNILFHSHKTRVERKLSLSCEKKKLQESAS